MARLTITARDVRWTTSRALRGWIRFGLLTTGVLAFFGVVLGTIGGTPAALAMAVPFVFTLLTRAALNRSAALGDGTLEVAQDGSVSLRARRAVQLKPDQIAWAARREGRVDVETPSGARLAFDAASSEEAQRFLDVTGTGVEQRTMSLRLRSVIGPLVAGLLFYLAALVPFGFAFTFAGPLAIVLTNLAALAVAVGLVRLFVSPSITVGIDGVTVKRGARPRFIPYGDIARVAHLAPGTSSAYGLSLELVGGETLMLPTIGVGEDEIMRVVQRIDDARRARVEGAATEAFARRGASLEDWQGRLRGLFEGDTGFRQQRVSVDDAVRTVADPQANLERRFGAALALRVAAPDRADQVRFAAEAALEPRTRRVLLAAADEGANLEAALELLAEEEVARAADVGAL